MSRFAHLVGSIPAEDVEDAMSIALDHLGDHLLTLPDGETGERRNWIIHIVESLRHHPDLELARDGRWTDYEDTPTFRIRRGHELDGSTLDFGHVEAFERNYPVFRRLRSERGREDLAFQVGLPGDFDLALFTLGPAGAFRNRRPFTDATLREIREITARADGDVVFQVEVPAELVFVSRTPGPAQPMMAGRLARGITDLVAASPAGTRFGVHLCLGDMNHRALGHMRDVAPLVHLTNAIASRWPSGRRLDFVHAPLAAAEEPPPNRQGFYAPLVRLRLDPEVRFVAGFVHEAQHLEAQQALRDHLESLLGREVGIAASCGLGRREREPALATMKRAAVLCET
jgi:hypothetical protein